MRGGGWLAHLGVSVDNGWNSVVVNVARLSCQHLHAGEAILLGLVRKHGSRDDVTDGVHSINAALTQGKRLIDSHKTKAAYSESDSWVSHHSHSKCGIIC